MNIKANGLIGFMLSIQLFCLCASQPESSCAQDQVTSNMPKTLEILYAALDKCEKQRDILHSNLVCISRASNAIKERYLLWDHTTQALDVNLYEQKFLLQKIKMVEEVHSSLPEGQILNAFIHVGDASGVVLMRENIKD